MPVLDFPAFAEALPKIGPLLGIDPGQKRIGIAATDAHRTIASSVDTIARKRFIQDAQKILSHYDTRKCVGVVIGLPLNMDGSSGPAAQAARAFARNLSSLRDSLVLMWDERLSTSAVTKALIEADASRARRAQVVDKMAAAYMLQGAIDALKERALGADADS